MPRATTPKPVRRLITGLVATGAAALLLAGAACSGGGAAADPGKGVPEATPSVSTPPEAPELTNSSFTNAVEFARLVHIDKNAQATSLVAKGSPAERYMAHQVAGDKAIKLAGTYTAVDPDTVTIDGNEKPGSVKIEIDNGDEDPTEYTWKDFKFDPAGKIKSWTGKSGPIESVLWSRESKADGRAVDGRLVSAYRTNAGSMYVVVEWRAKRSVKLFSATYTAHGGYRQKATEEGLYEVDKGEKILSYYVFDDAEFGGKMRIDVSDANGYEIEKLSLTVR